MLNDMLACLLAYVNGQQAFRASKSMKHIIDLFFTHRGCASRERRAMIYVTPLAWNKKSSRGAAPNDRELLKFAVEPACSRWKDYRLCEA